MIANRRLSLLTCGAMLLLVAGCGNHSARVLAPTAREDRASVTAARVAPAQVNRSAEALTDCPDPTYLGPVITLEGPGLNYTYATGGYCVCESAIIPYDLPANRTVTFNWSADASGACTDIRWYRWTLDIADVFDETPRIDEATDLSHWSQRSLATSATIGPFSPESGSHLFMVDAMDGNGFRSLGLIRINVTAAVNRPPDCAGAVAALLANGNPNGSFGQVAITGVTDPDGDPVTITVTGVSQDEPLVGIGERRTCPDAMIESGAALVRQERSGIGNGRVYTIAFTADDGQGGISEGSVEVRVPLYPGAHGDCVKDALSVNSLEVCERARPTLEP